MATSTPKRSHDASPAPLYEVGNQSADLSCIAGDATSASAVDNSVDNCCSRVSNEQSVNLAVSRPHVPCSVEEISLITNLDCWSNCNVRVIGNVSPTPHSTYWTLVSIGEEGGPFSVSVDLGLIDKYPSPGLQVQVFGEIRMSDSNPVIQAKFFRDFSSVDIFFYNKGLEVVKKHAPHFVGRKNKVQSTEDAQGL
ncbi:hypothetical protein ONE63_007845 [Megalurothrips usitatus]|uniref:Uncharacterized protein n=1 Tax=Megalurothrips usitatus TaxID=439358 RepID=A0AAV7XVW1_9NEOP|nr:hypothetical protein ONE63_007845 [Megalurothrips usitatus]